MISIIQDGSVELASAQILQEDFASAGCFEDFTSAGIILEDFAQAGIVRRKILHLPGQLVRRCISRNSLSFNRHSLGRLKISQHSLEDFASSRKLRKIFTSGGQLRKDFALVGRAQEDFCISRESSRRFLHQSGQLRKILHILYKKNVHTVYCIRRGIAQKGFPSAGIVLADLYQSGQLRIFLHQRDSFLKYILFFIQHCLICCSTDSRVSEDAVIEPRTVATLAFAVRCSNHSAIFHSR